MSRQSADAGFTLSELMVVVAVMGTAAAAAVPGFGRDSAAATGRSFAQEITQELQRARMEAVTTRLPRHAFIYSNRIEIRAARPGATPTSPLLAPTAADPILHTIRGGMGVNIFDVTGSASTPSFNLSTTTSKQIVFGTMGAGFIGPTAPGSPAAVYLYINNDTVKDNHPERKFRVDVAPLSGQVALRRKW